MMSGTEAMDIPSPRKLGVHTSIAGGLSLAFERAAALGCSTMQIFSHNPRQWKVRELLPEEIRLFLDARQLSGIGPVFVHASYLLNLCASDPTIFEKSVQLLVAELDLAGALGAEYLVLHTGSASGDPPERARQKAILALKAVAGQDWNCAILLENTAGERGDISSKMEEMAEIAAAVPGGLIGGICLDSCHAFQAGYDLSRDEGIELLASEIERYLGKDYIKLIHLNDSKRTYFSRVDRHEHLGQGAIGAEGLRAFVNHPAFRTSPLVLETPRNTEGDDRRNLEKAREYLL